MEDPESRDAEFHRVIGEALTRWGGVESAHCLLFSVGVTRQLHNQPIQMAYWAVTSFEARQKMAEKALTEVFCQHPEFLARWKSLNERLRAKNSKRNMLAHCQLVRHNKPGTEPTIKIVPYYHGRIIADPTKAIKESLRLQDVRGISEAFAKLRADLHGLLDDLRTNYFDHGDGDNEAGTEPGEIFMYPRPAADSGA